MRRILKNLKLMETHFPGEAVTGIIIMQVKETSHIIIVNWS